MPVPKRYFHLSQEINGDPEMWAFTSKFGDRSIRTWLQILVYLDKSENEWRVGGDWLGTLARTVRQSIPNVRRQITWMIAHGWLIARELSGKGSPLIYSAPKWLKYHRKKEQNATDSSAHVRVENDPLLSSPTPPPTPTPFHPFPTPEIKEEELIKSSVSVVPRKRPSAEVLRFKSSATWEAYAHAYRRRYGTDPVRNAKVNKSLSRLVDRLGADEAPQVAGFYLTHNKPFYVSARHSTDLLIRDAEGLRTEWITGSKATTTEARNAEQVDNVHEQVKRVRAMMTKGGL